MLSLKTLKTTVDDYFNLLLGSSLIKLFLDGYLVGKTRVEHSEFLDEETYRTWKKKHKSITNQAIEDSLKLQIETLKNRTIINLTNLLAQQEIKSKLSESTILPLDEISKVLEKTQFEWERIVATELSKAHTKGAIDAILEDNWDKKPHEIRVFVEGNPGQDACDWCRKFYHEGNSYKIYTLAELLENTSNIGKKTKDWKPTLPPLHPFCSHRLVELLPGWELDEQGVPYYTRELVKKSHPSKGQMKPGHKYIKRTGGPGNYKYWYKDENGKLYTGDNSPSDHPDYDVEQSNKKVIKVKGPSPKKGPITVKPKKDPAASAITSTPAQKPLEKPLTAKTAPQHVKEAFNFWTLDGYTPIRAIQRGQQDVLQKYLSKVNDMQIEEEEGWEGINDEIPPITEELVRQHMKVMDENIKKLPIYEGDISRILEINPNKLQDYLNLLKPGQEYEMEAHSSFSKGTPKTGLITDPNVKLIVKQNKSGRDISSFSHYDEEEEVLVPKGTKYKVVDHKQEQGLFTPVHVITLEEINNEE
jgi:hypothetical protein